jgi:RNA polymerase sigma-70 factor (ECF subfamily)
VALESGWGALVAVCVCALSIAVVALVVLRVLLRRYPGDSAMGDTTVHRPAPHASEDDRRLVAALKAGDERAFAELIDRYHASMVRLAMNFVSSRAVAEEVAAEAWEGVLRGIDRFEGRSSLRTWIFRILTNTAKSRGERESRVVPFSSLAPADEPEVDPERFLPTEPRWAGHWTSPPQRWDVQPEASVLGGEVQQVIRAAIDTLPPNQATVIRLRDLEGFSSEEVRTVLDVSEANQRVLLHRARSRVRAALEDYFDEGDPGAPAV